MRVFALALLVWLASNSAINAGEAGIPSSIEVTDGTLSVTRQVEGKSVRITCQQFEFRQSPTSLELKCRGNVTVSFEMTKIRAESMSLKDGEMHFSGGVAVEKDGTILMLDRRRYTAEIARLDVQRTP